MRRDIPQEWVELMSRRGIGSLRQLAAASNISHTAIARIVHGEGTAKDESLQQLAAALQVPPATVYAIVGARVSGDLDPYTPPAEAARLSPRERKAVDELIRLLVDQKPLTNDVPLPKDAYSLAASKGPNRGRAAKEDADALGEESQDPQG
ncbi:helix-turn-helix domain-containing protein [Arthrobacter sp. N1]|uniref:helix-turn-helix domain-containing protein n=1 Tax=Arthrobacter sp. N1 TaxID=619291 RepID=UPI003BB20F32